MNVKPVGWCAANRKQLNPPKVCLLVGSGLVWFDLWFFTREKRNGTPEPICLKFWFGN